MSTTRNLVNLSGVGKDYAARTILEDVTLGIADRDRIGVVGGNGQGKSTLLELIAGSEQPDSGQVTRLGGLRIGMLDQGDRLPAGETIREVLVGERPEHEWAGDREFRGVLDGLLGGVALDRFTGGIETPVAGAVRRRAAPHRPRAGPARPPGPAAAGRADQPPRRRGDHLAGAPTLPRATARC